METITFYSYKGGVGRTLLLANVARYFALLGKRVVAVDLDFEAPGLHYKLNIGDVTERLADSVPKQGVVDYLLSSLDDEPRMHPPLDQYLVSVPLPHTEPDTGRLWLMPAGSAPSGGYWKRLTSLLRRDLVVDADGRVLAAVLDLKARLEAEYRADMLLIDSRTGITELGGIATSVLADKVVCLFLDNRESLMGTRAVMQSLRQASRLPDDHPVKLFAVLSRTSNNSARHKEGIREFLNDDGPPESEMVGVDQLFVLRSDPDLEVEEQLHVGGDLETRRKALHGDYLILASALTDAAPEDHLRAARRREAVQGLVSWLTEDDRGDDLSEPSAFELDQIDEGVKLGGRYADVVAFSGDDRAEALLAAEYVEGNLGEADAWQWWERNTRLRCLIVFSDSSSHSRNERRVFTRGRGTGKFTERDGSAAWGVKWPLSFAGLDDPGDRSVPTMLSAVRRGEDGFLGPLLTEWQRSVMFGTHGGMPFRPDRAQEILDGLASVEDVDTARRILWRTAPDPFEGRRRGFPEEFGMNEQMYRELHAPLWWRLPARAKGGVHHRHPRGGGAPRYGLEMLARDLLGLSMDQDRILRDETARLLPDSEATADTAHTVSSAFRALEFGFEFSDGVPTELVRRAFLHRANAGIGRESRVTAWDAAEADARDAMANDDLMNRLCRSSEGRPELVTTNLLGAYESDRARVTLYSKAIEWCARGLGVDLRALENVVLLHETVHAVSHLGADLDGRMWESFSLPSSRNPAFRPDTFHEGIAQYFTFRMIERLGDQAMMKAFETLTSSQPREYQAWRGMQEVPVERVREILMAARSGLAYSLRTLS